MSSEDKISRGPRALRVLGALLGGSPEAALLRHAIHPPVTLRTVENRLHVLSVFREVGPHVTVFAVHDGNRLPTAPLIAECMSARPSSRIVLICAAPPPRTVALLTAARAGARVFVAPTPTDLELIFERITRSLAAELALDCETFTAVEPPMLRQLLCAAAITVAGDGRVVTLARHLSVSTRTLSRYARRAGLVSPKGLLAATRLLWGCALRESACHDLGTLARAIGFVRPSDMRAATRRYLAPLSSGDAVTSLPRYEDALRRVVRVLGGRIAT